MLFSLLVLRKLVVTTAFTTTATSTHQVDSRIMKLKQEYFAQSVLLKRYRDIDYENSCRRYQIGCMTCSFYYMCLCFSNGFEFCDDVVSSHTYRKRDRYRDRERERETETHTQRERKNLCKCILCNKISVPYCSVNQHHDGK